MAKAHWPRLTHSRHGVTLTFHASFGEDDVPRVTVYFLMPADAVLTQFVRDRRQLNNSQVEFAFREHYVLTRVCFAQTPANASFDEALRANRLAAIDFVRRLWDVFPAATSVTLVDG